jgi:phytanoyl-CoA hydroxylase
MVTNVSTVSVQHSMDSGTQKLRASYLEKGYVVAKQCLDHDALDRVVEDYRRLVDLQLAFLGAPVLGHTGVQGLGEACHALIEADIKRFFAAGSLAQNLPSMTLLTHSEGVLGLIRALGVDFPSLMARTILHNQSAKLTEHISRVGGYHLLAQHQDWRAMQGSLDALTIWIPLCDVDGSNYPLAVAPGSHRRGLMKAVLGEGDVFRLNDAECLPDDSFEIVEVDKGDVLVLSGFVVHKSHHTPGMTGPRFAIGARFNNAAEPTFVERSFPAKHIMRLDPSIADENWPAAIDVQAYIDANQA